MSVTCPCGTVADEIDPECSLCGRDLTSLRTRAQPQPSSGFVVPQADAVSRSGGTATQRSQPYGSYPDPPVTHHPAFQPASGWTVPPTERSSAAGAAGTYSGGVVAGIVLAALALVMAGLAFGYFVIAGFLPD
jgi:hypothetical protein